MRKKWGSSLAWAVIAIFVSAVLVWAGTQDMGDGDYKFDGNVTFNGTVTNTGAVTNSSTVANTGAVTNSGYVVESSVTRFTQVSGTTKALGNTYNTWLVTRTGLISGATMPQITATNSGFEIGIKLASSGTTIWKIVPYSSDDAFEVTQGTFAGTSCYLLDAPGDYMMWKGVYISGASNQWFLMIDER